MTLEGQFRRVVRVPCKSKLPSSEEDSDNGALITPTLQQYSDESDIYYPLHTCSTLLRKQCEIMERYHFA